MYFSNDRLLFPQFLLLLISTTLLNCLSIVNVEQSTCLVLHYKNLCLIFATVLHENYWEREGWCELKQDVYTFSQCLGGYVDY